MTQNVVKAYYLSNLWRWKESVLWYFFLSTYDLLKVHRQKQMDLLKNEKFYLESENDPIFEAKLIAQGLCNPPFAA